MREKEREEEMDRFRQYKKAPRRPYDRSDMRKEAAGLYGLWRWTDLGTALVLLFPHVYDSG